MASEKLNCADFVGHNPPIITAVKLKITATAKNRGTRPNHGNRGDRDSVILQLFYVYVTSGSTSSEMIPSETSGRPWTHRPLRGVDAVRLQVLLMAICRQCGSWSVAGHNYRKVIG